MSLRKGAVAYAYSKDPDQPAHLHGLIMALAVCLLDAIEYIDRQKRSWSENGNTYACLGLGYPHVSRPISWDLDYLREVDTLGNIITLNFGTDRPEQTV